MDQRPSTERTFRVSLTEISKTKIEVAATLDGQAVAGPVASALGADFPRSYHEFLTERRRGGLGESDPAEALAQLGDTVGAVVFPGAMGDRLDALLVETRAANAQVAVEIETASPNLLSIPFEAARSPGGTVVALEPGVRMVRRYARGTKAAGVAPPALPGPLSILVAVGAPDEGKTRSAVLDLEAELAAILDAVEKPPPERSRLAARPGEGYPSQIEEADRLLNHESTLRY